MNEVAGGWSSSPQTIYPEGLNLLRLSGLTKPYVVNMCLVMTTMRMCASFTLTRQHLRSDRRVIG